MRPKILLLSALACLAAIPAGALHDAGFRIDRDPLAGPDVFTLSWIAKEGLFYTLTGSETLHAPWFSLAQETDFQDDELAEWQLETDADRFFVKLLMEEDTGIRITATCEADEGVRIEVDGSVWAIQSGWNPFDDLVEELVIERATSRHGPFDDTIITLQLHEFAIWKFSFFDRKVEQGVTYYYRVRFTYRDFFWVEHQGPPSNVAFVHVTCVPSLPELVAVCRNDRIVLKWEAPTWALPASQATILSWTLMRSDEEEGPYVPVYTNDNLYVNTMAVHADYPPDSSPEETYYYYFNFTYRDGAGFILTSPNSVPIAASTCPIPPLGPIDVAFIIDNTQSFVLNAVTELKKNQAIDAILNDIEAASGGDYRLALVSPDADIVNVRLQFAPGNRVAFKETLQYLPSISGGNHHPESTDECLNTVVNGLLASDRDAQVECNGKPEVQEGDFFPPFGEALVAGNLETREALKLVVLITDDRPSGFCDERLDEWTYDPHGLRAIGYAQQAAAMGIRISSIMIEMPWWEEVAPIMLDYADITCGLFSHLNSHGLGIDDAILEILYELPVCAP